MHNPCSSYSNWSDQMTDSDSGSFEVVEEEEASPNLQQSEVDPALRVNHEAELGTVSEALCIDTSSLSGMEDDIPADLVGSMESSKAETVKSPVHPPPVVAYSDSLVSYPKRRSSVKKVETYPSPEVQPVQVAQSSPQLLESHHKCVAVFTALLGITLVLLWTTIQNSNRISRLQDELSTSKLQHIEDLLRVSKERCGHESKMQNLMSEIEQERHLLQELRVQSEKHAARERETANLIVELQAERHQLMRALDGQTHGLKPQHKNPWSRDSILIKIRKIKEALKGGSPSFPGYQYLNKLFCQIPSFCDDDD